MFRKSVLMFSISLLCTMTCALNAQTRPGYLQLDGAADYVQIPDSDDFSVATRKQLTVSAWIRPDTLNFDQQTTDGYVNWLGKGEGTGANGQQEWAFRMYSHTAPAPAERTNRISFDLFNASGGEGNGSFFQEPVRPGEWIHVVAVVDNERTAIFRNGVLMDCDRYRGEVQPGEDCDPPNVVIQPQNGTAPLRIGSSDLQSYFKGGIREVRIWNRTLTPTEVGRLYTNNSVPRNSLTAEYLLNRYSGRQALDSAYAHHGTITGATFASPIFLTNLTNNQTAFWWTDGSDITSGILFNELLPTGWQIAAAADFDRDGWTDLALQNLTTRQVAIWFVRGSRVIRGALATALLPADWKVVASEDFNGDTWPDMVLQNVTTRQVAAWFMNGTIVTNGLLLNETLPVDWNVVASGEFDGDGTPDLVLQNLNTNRVAFWMVQNWRVTAGRVSDTPLQPGWEIAGVGDFVSDGHSDLLLQNLSENLAAVWVMNNWMVIDTRLTNEPLPADWQIVGSR